MINKLSKNQKIFKKIKTTLEGLTFVLGAHNGIPLTTWSLAAIRNFPTKLMAFKNRMACENPDAGSNMKRNFD